MEDALSDLRSKYDDLAASFGPALAATAAVARLDEASRRTGGRNVRLARHEALALARREGLGCDEARLLAHLSGGGEDVVSKVERTTADLMLAHQRILSLTPGSVEPIELVEAWNLSESWNPRAPSKSAGYVVDVDRYAETLARLLNAFADDPTPIEGADLVGRIVRERIFPRPDRMACLVAPVVMRLALGAPTARFGMAGHMPEPDRLASMAPSDLGRAILASARAGAAAALADLVNTLSLRADLSYRVAGERAGSRTPEAIDAFVDIPVLGIVALQGIVGLTHRGANQMMRRLVVAGVVRAHRANRAKGRLYVCDRALVRPS